jgi:hypothetical protein
VQLEHERVYRLSTPGPIESLSGQAWCKVFTLESRSMTRRAVLPIGDGTGCGLRLSKDRWARGRGLTQTNGLQRTQRDNTTAQDPYKRVVFHDRLPDLPDQIVSNESPAF